jgi:hypothetical protein
MQNINRLCFSIYIRNVRENQEELEWIGIDQLLVYADDISELGEGTNTVKKNIEALLQASKEVGL